MGVHKGWTMGHWDYHAIERFAGETLAQVQTSVPAMHGVHLNGEFLYEGIPWVHVGWSDANAVAYRALVAFCLQTGRRWITSYATDARAFLDDSYFGDQCPEREQRLNKVFGPPDMQQTEAEPAPPL
jgi:hypothetical protein